MPKTQVMPTVASRAAIAKERAALAAELTPLSARIAACRAIVDPNTGGTSGSVSKAGYWSARRELPALEERAAELLERDALLAEEDHLRQTLEAEQRRQEFERERAP